MVLEREAATSNLLCKLSFCPRQGGSCCCSVTTCRNGNFYQLWGILLVAAHVAQPGPGFGSWRGERDSSGQEAKPGTQQLRDDFRDGCCHQGICFYELVYVLVLHIQSKSPWAWDHRAVGFIRKSGLHGIKLLFLVYCTNTPSLGCASSPSPGSCNCDPLWSGLQLLKPPSCVGLVATPSVSWHVVATWGHSRSGHWIFRFNWWYFKHFLFSSPFINRRV